MYNALGRTASDIHLILVNGCGLLQMAYYRKQVAVVAESFV